MFVVFYKDDNGKLAMTLVGTEQGVTMVANYMTSDRTLVVAFPLAHVEDGTWRLIHNEP